MALLASLISHHSNEKDDTSSVGDLTELVPRLWPFLRHTISAVRTSALQTLNVLLKRLPDAVDNKVKSIIQVSKSALKGRFGFDNLYFYSIKLN